MCDCHVALFVLKNRLFRCDRLSSIDWLRSNLSIWSIKFRLNDLIDWVIANIWCIIVHRSHFQDSLVDWHLNMLSQYLWPFFMATISAIFSLLRQRLAYMSRSSSPKLQEVQTSCSRNLQESCSRNQCQLCAFAGMLTPCTGAAVPLAETRSPSHSPNPSLCISESYLIASAGSLAPPGGPSPQGPVINILIYITAGPVTNIYRYAPQDRSPIYWYTVTTDQVYTQYIPGIYLAYIG